MIPTDQLAKPSWMEGRECDADSPAVSVNCGGCTKCCHVPCVVDRAWGDKVHRYQTQPATITWRGDEPVTILKMVDGHCIYLVDGKCSIYNRRPRMCRVYSCIGMTRRLKRELSPATIREGFRRGMFDLRTWQEGERRLNAGEQETLAKEEVVSSHRG